VFTASVPEYANVVLKLLDPKKQYIKHRLYRDQCTHIGDTYVKDLSLLGRDLANVVIIDNMAECFAYHVSFRLCLR
jgi:TFIIF-interacting CTD phosphatase-like protein